MIRAVILDTGVLGLLVHPKQQPEIAAWVRRLSEAGVAFCLPEVADYELRRELLRMRSNGSVQKLDQLRGSMTYLPISTAAMRLAADLWAGLRQGGQPTAHPHALDGDVILAAQARLAHLELKVPAAEVTVVAATTNVGHLGRMVTAQEWAQIA